MKKVLTLLMVTVFVISTLSGCGKNKDTNASKGTDVSAVNQTAEEETKETAAEATKETAEGTSDKVPAYEEMAAKFPTDAANDNPSIEGGTLKVALVDSSAFAGVLNPCFYEDEYDNQILTWFTEPIISYDENFVADQDGAATYEYDKDAKTITLHMREGVKWHDGEPVTLDDLVFAYEVICDKDYEGLRYDDSVTNVVGAEEYHKGTADTISGLELSKDKMTLTIHFKDFYPSILVGGFWTNPIPRHYYEGIAIKDMAADPKTRQNPIGFGPFKVKNVVPGESVELERFDDYWMGKPKLDGVVVTVVNPDLVPSAMEEGKYDVAEFSTQQYPNYTNPTNYQYIGEIQTVFSYTGFKLGKWDQAKNENIYDSNCKMANVKLRQAIGYAVDNETIGQQLYSGLRFLATTVITPRHGAYQNKELAGYNYDPEKAKKLLDEAGYLDVDGDGFREDPSGKPFTVTWATMDGENADAYAQYKIQNWADVGLKVELYNGRLTEFNAFYDAVEGDDPAIDMYDGAWQTGYDPNPASLWGHNSSANYTRYTSENFDTIIKDISSDKGWDNDFLSKRYHDWQQQFFDEVPAIPTLWRMRLKAVNSRVKNYTMTETDIKQTEHLIELTAEEPAKK
ncbi:oligopeptide ABC transporter substrate-binding protein [Anaerocolumna sp. MB42-C2]|uniref:oligopeptide ABC transporter substrate-binding protein n=1 Tax=Anaerocolumna sp. MB42-C2 TaxID=3070997 RepID=UPI0027E04C17|nr:oligopeptide ABC transporter substrate-binding protein [Anaerocolumna sp. MB42-C2]WMJ87604.1 oligopeptide ABC transporter substrate-binding protein [Anaerocolumna sp. MB42-C2]